MKRTMEIIKFLDDKKSGWYRVKEVKINCSKSHYEKGEIISFKKQKYIVEEDRALLRVTKPEDPSSLCRHKPLTALIH
ncbi:hypothetical protein [Sporolactobacillus pectinivorans]|uniref:hypothetical protein n=1 Tax=Sporolactobacillus pectinivorans TaxID=1591408 RepID=UPI000C26800B|nr:hypothetical protein [Sporolactobacillus pectinivorans]